MPGILFGKDWRDRRDKIILDQKDVRSVHRHKWKAAELVTEKNAVTRGILNRKVERDRFGELLIEKGGGKNRSRYKDWGVTGVTDLGDIAETMAREHLITPKEARAMASELTGATGARKRELLNRLSNSHLGRKKPEPIPISDRDAKLSERKPFGMFGRTSAAKATKMAAGAGFLAGVRKSDAGIALNPTHGVGKPVGVHGFQPHGIMPVQPSSVVSQHPHTPSIPSVSGRGMPAVPSASKASVPPMSVPRTSPPAAPVSLRPFGKR
ncbi:MAG: hypothetical protein HGB18_00505 [Candidatus Moranbacteria bacterium]|nr:hypothetical protein [Candidatus Moranbacteria bacterium]